MHAGVFNLVSFTIFLNFFVLFSSNPLWSIISLILVFFSATVTLLFLEVFFFGLVLLVVYVGAIAVLFLFVVMLLNISTLELEVDNYYYFPIGFFMVCILFGELFFLVEGMLSL